MSCISLASLGLAGGDDGTRTRDLMRDRRKQAHNDRMRQSEISHYSCARREGLPGVRRQLDLPGDDN